VKAKGRNRRNSNHQPTSARAIDTGVITTITAIVTTGHIIEATVTLRGIMEATATLRGLTMAVMVMAAECNLRLRRRRIPRLV